MGDGCWGGRGSGAWDVAYMPDCYRLELVALIGTDVPLTCPYWTKLPCKLLRPSSSCELISICPLDSRALEERPELSAF